MSPSKMQSNKKTILKIFVALFLITGGLLFVQSVFAQFGINEVGNEIALPATEDPRIVAARIIRVALGFLGIIALAIVLYGGFVWMTAAGNEERLSKAKKILTSGVIGLVIILSAFGITQYVLTKLTEAITGVVTGGEAVCGNGSCDAGETCATCAADCGSCGLPGDFLVRSIMPSGSIPIRNVVVRVVFNQNVDITSLTNNFTVKKSFDQSPVAGTNKVSGNIVEFTPSAACPAPNTDRFCFDADTEFTVEATTDVKNTGGRKLKAKASQTFTAGNLIDVAGPFVEISDPDPGQSVSADALVTVQAYSTDDAGISYLQYFADGAGTWDPDNVDTPTATPPPREYFGSRDWDTRGLTLLSRHTLTSEAFDIDTNNTTSGGVDVIIRAAHCFNDGDAPDADEIGVDCGGADCGACDGDSCAEDSQCRSGHCCAGNVCCALPTISGVVPDDGAIGNYVTIYGDGFGATPGSVYFFDNKLAALPAACSASATWQNKQIIVEVPSGAVDGPIKVTVPAPTGATAADYTDTTDDARGPLLPNFDVNDVKRPGICGVSPASGTPKTGVTVTGTQFGDTQGASEINFGGTRAERVESWTNGSITATVPLIAPAAVPVQVIKDGENSNPFNFTVTPVAEQPKILRFEPTSGPVGEYVTIFGSNFGDARGTVSFIASDETSFLAATDFPDACDKNWKNDSVVVKVPAEIAIRPSYVLKITTAGGLSDDTLDLDPRWFEATTGTAGPGICQIQPDNGPADLSVALNGERFGATGIVKFWENKTAATTAWGDTEISTLVPSGAATGSVNVTVGTATSNDLNFTVRDCRDARTPCPAGQECCANGSCATEGGCAAAPGRGYYFWQFSTGTIPVYPQVVEECAVPPTPPLWDPSPSPWSKRGQTEVCVNAKITVRFTTLIDHLTLDGNILVQECGDETCAANLVDIFPSSDFPDVLDLSSKGQTEVLFLPDLPDGKWEPDKWYQVTLEGGTNDAPAGIASFEGFYLDGDKDGNPGGNYIFKFKTRASTDLCEVGWVSVQPHEEKAEEENEQIAYLANPLAANDACLVLDGRGYSWGWSVNDPKGRSPQRASVDAGWCKGGDPPAWESCARDHARVTANNETVPDGDVRIKATLPAPVSKFGYGNLTIDYTDPKVVEKWPDCREACINADIGVRFNTRMNAESLTGTHYSASVINPANVKLYIWRCGNGVVEIGEDCDDGNITPGDGCGADCLNEGTALCSGFNPASPGTPGTGSNCCGNGRRETGEDCDGVPFPVECKAVTGVTDNCTNKGRSTCPGFNPASPGTPGTGSNCCGNGKIEEGEDCEPPTPGPLGSDGCDTGCHNVGSKPLTPVPSPVPSTDYSLSIVPTYREESKSGGGFNYILDFNPYADFFPNTWYRAVISGNVESRSRVKLTDLNYDRNGDNTDDSYSWTFKTKNDATLCSVDRVEVSPEETRLTFVGATQDYVSNPYGAPDECNPNGQRLKALSYDWSWSSEKTAVATVSNNDDYPKCGNGVIEFGEDCDDGNTTPGDGCNARCLSEGSDAAYSSTCGNGQRETGEDCDDGNARSGDGCNSKCQNEGSIAGGSTCGNFALENGEDCDDGNTTSGDGCSSICLNEGRPSAGLGATDSRVDPYQTAATVGLDPDDVTAGKTESTTKIISGTGVPLKTGSGDLTMVCGYGSTKPCTDPGCAANKCTGSDRVCTNDSDCRVGVGADSCCHFKPKVEMCNPSAATTCSSEATNVCRNALISVTFDQEMDPASIMGNMIIARKITATAKGADPCPTGSQEKDEPAPSANQWCYDCPSGSTVWDETPASLGSGDEWCFGGDVATGQTVIRQDTKTVDFNLNRLLEKDKRYKVIVKGDNTGTADTVDGVKSKAGVALGGTLVSFRDGEDYQSWAWTFKTGNDVCILDHVTIDWDATDPPTADPQFHLFNSVETDNPWGLAAHARDYLNRDIVSIPNVYAWSWAWASSIADTGPTNVVSISNSDSATQTATAQNRNGEETLSAVATITADAISGITCEKLSEGERQKFCSEGATTTCTTDANCTAATPSKGICVEEITVAGPCPSGTTPKTGIKTETGTALATVFLCENPWPDNFYTNGSYKDDSYNFKTHYCRDRGESVTSDDLPAFSTPVTNTTPGSTRSANKDDLLKEYFFFPQGNYCSISQTPCTAATAAVDCPPGSGAGECRPTPDAIGVRIYENMNHLSPTDWYSAQGLAFGGPQSIEVDGYEAVRDGRTVYVSAANDPGGSSNIYTNIYLFSYNEGANSDTVNIYSQLLDNLRFNINITNLGICTYRVCSNNLTKSCSAEDSECRTGTDTTSVCSPFSSCSKDIDCPWAFAGSSAITNVCQAPKDKLTRDVKRITDLLKIQESLENYRLTAGYYPKLEAGTYIRALTASVWGSWAGALGSELKTSLPTDPINQIVNCTGTDTGTDYDPTTCWNVDARSYMCPSGSRVYQYKFDPGDGTYELQSDFEYSGDSALWENELSDRFEIQNTCEGTSMSNTGICGDGVINGGEQCEVGMAKEETCTIRTCEKLSGGTRQKFCSGDAATTCTTDANCIDATPSKGICVEEITVVGNCDSSKGLSQSGSSKTGRQAYDCDQGTCKWRTIGGCNALCGDGVVQTGEQCDQGPTGGRVPKGGTSQTNQYACTRADAPTSPGACKWKDGWCGDGTQQTAYGEKCDDGSYNGTYGKRCAGAKGKSCTGDLDCLSTERPCGPYCKLDCGGASPYCGDEITNGSEECDGNTETAECTIAKDGNQYAECDPVYIPPDSLGKGGNYKCIPPIAGGTYFWSAAEPVAVTYRFTGIARGAYNLRLITQNESQDLSAKMYSDILPSDFCAGDGIYHHLKVSVNGSYKGKLCNLAKNTPQVGVLPLGSLDAGSHEIKIEWDNDWNPAIYCSSTQTQKCNQDSDCPSGETCKHPYDSNVRINSVSLAPTGGYEYFRTRNCNSQCAWNSWGACAHAGVCGNGKKEGAEECDDGNTNNNDGCIITSSGSPFGPNNCKLARCGDGFVKTGVEACDAGAANGTSCSPRPGAKPGETCNYCEAGCYIKTVTKP